LPVRMSVEQVSGSAWAECPNGVESAIDGPVTLIMAMGRALVAGVDDGDDFMNAIRNPIIA
ncbi:hypothetical protein N1E68_31880, partial [Pseudomonas aeruginosa]|nr:hypothetical protein [Pseudomonas aeruginosa]MCS9418146.1 hypothetical protein [Pseudomonas aeruginosa]